MRVTLLVTLMSGLVALGCSNSRPTPTETQAGVSVPATAEALTAALVRQGFVVHAADTIQQPFFSVAARVFTVDGRDLQVYEYASGAAAAAEAAKIHPGGMIGTSSPMWIAPPHFFHRDRLIVIYLGADPKAISALTEILGPELAGSR